MAGAGDCLLLVLRPDALGLLFQLTQAAPDHTPQFVERVGHTWASSGVG